MKIEEVPAGIPVRAPNESPADYLRRLREYQDQEDIVKTALKEAQRREKRIRSTVERVIIEKEVRRALKGPGAHKARFYQLPKDPGGLLIFLPLYLLLSIVWQNITHTDAGINKRIGLTQNKDIK
jgi:hypothetical protein